MERLSEWIALADLDGWDEEETRVARTIQAWRGGYLQEHLWHDPTCQQVKRDGFDSRPLDRAAGLG